MKYEMTIDAGSSKTEWVLTDGAGNELGRAQTVGINALMTNGEEIGSLALEALERMGSKIVPERVNYYGAGCSTPQLCAKVERAIGDAYARLADKEGVSVLEVTAASDLLGAARSLLGRESGIACILGTGSNSCLYDGEHISEHIPSLGYVLGDEGSGNAIGRRLVSDALKGIMPGDLADGFLEWSGLDVAEVLDRVYRKPRANRFLASLCPFAKEHIDHPYMTDLVVGEFCRFLDRNVMQYEDADCHAVSFTGSIAYHFSPQLHEACEMRGLRMGTVTCSPIDGLVDYHTRRNAAL